MKQQDIVKARKTEDTQVQFEKRDKCKKNKYW